MLWIQFISCAAIVVVASSVLSKYADVIAEKTGLGRAWVGAILLAGVTSLPEMVSGITAVRVLNAPNLAIGGIMGSNLFNLTLIAVMDVVYQPGSILSRAQEGHILSGGFGILLMALVVSSQLIGVPFNGSGVAGISYISLGLIALYFVGARLLAVFQRRRAAEVLDHEAAVLNYAAITPRRAYSMFALAALIVVIAGVWLSSISEGIADETGLGRSFVGALFLGISTSLPEITATITLVRMGAIDLAIGNVLGSNLFNVTLLAVYDIFDGGGNLWVAMSPANALAAIISIMMTAVVIVSLIYRASSKTPFRVMWDAPVLVIMYLVAMFALYQLR